MANGAHARIAQLELYPDCVHVHTQEIYLQNYKASTIEDPMHLGRSCGEKYTVYSLKSWLNATNPRWFTNENAARLTTSVLFGKIYHFPAE